MSSIINSKREIEDATQSLDILELYLEATEQQHAKQDSSKMQYDRIIINHLTFAYPQFTEYELKYFDILLKKIDKSTTKSDKKLNQLHAIQEAKEKAKEISPIILHNTHITFEKGKIYGIVGRNGAGKTTMMHLLMNYFTLPSKSIMRGRHGNEDL
jgi:ABC-type multidrug transport system fused ATPase/permease subunit